MGGNARELREKFRQLLPELIPEDLVAALSKTPYRRREKNGRIGVRCIKPITIRGWLEEPEPLLRENSRTVIRMFLATHKIVVLADWWACDPAEASRHVEKIAKTVLLAETDPVDAEDTDEAEELSPLGEHKELIQKFRAGGARDDSFAFSLDLPFASIIDERSAEVLSGKYAMYRYSFSQKHDVVCDIIYVGKRRKSEKEMHVELFCHPSRGVKDNGNPDRVRTEKYEGNLFRLGQMFCIICHNVVGNVPWHNRRLRYYLFPVVGGDPEEHYGIVSGFSPSLREPVAAKVFVEKIGAAVEPDGQESELVMRGRPNTRSGPRLSNQILDALKNTLSLGRPSVLITNQTDVVDRSNLPTEKSKKPSRSKEKPHRPRKQSSQRAKPPARRKSQPVRSK